MKSSDSDYFVTDFFINKMNVPSRTLRNNGCFNGIWSDKNINALTLSSDSDEINLRRSNAIYLSSEKKYRYFLVLNLNLSLKDSLKPLPKEADIKLTFFRANANKALLCKKLDSSTHQPEVKFPRQSIELINPVLEAIYFKSAFFDKQLMPHLIERVNWPFLDYSVRRELLNTDSIVDHRIKISSGKFILVLNIDQAIQKNQLYRFLHQLT